MGDMEEEVVHGGYGGDGGGKGGGGGEWGRWRRRWCMVDGVGGGGRRRRGGGGTNNAFLGGGKGVCVRASVRPCVRSVRASVCAYVPPCVRSSVGLLVDLSALLSSKTES